MVDRGSSRRSHAGGRYDEGSVAAVVDDRSLAADGAIPVSCTAEILSLIRWRVVTNSLSCIS